MKQFIKINTPPSKPLTMCSILREQCYLKHTPPSIAKTLQHSSELREFFVERGCLIYSVNQKLRDFQSGTWMVPKQYGWRRRIVICYWKINIFEKRINLKYETTDHITYEIPADTVKINCLKGKQN